MKKTLSVLLLTVLLIGSVFTLASCGALSGTYKGSALAFTFSGDDVAISTAGGELIVNAKYKINEQEDNKRTITFTYDEEAIESPVLKTSLKAVIGDGIDLSFVEGSDDNGSYIRIAMIFTFYKQ